MKKKATFEVVSIQKLKSEAVTKNVTNQILQR